MKKEGSHTKRNTIILALSIGCTLALNGCGHKNYVKVDLSSTHTTAAQETTSASAESTEPVKIDISDSQEAQNEDNKKDNASSITASIHTYNEGNVSIQYPVISNMEDSSAEEKINDLLKSNALEILKAYSVNMEKDSLTVECKVISAGRKRTTAVYTGLYSAEGAAHPSNLFYTNTVDITSAKDIGLPDFVDPYTLAGYILSDDCQFYDAEPDLTEALMAVRKDTSLESYAQLFQHADFPIQEKNSDGTPVFPESFSYEDHGTIIISIPLGHALGDYTLVKYTPVTK
jgi:hypothetical protein